MPNYKHLIAYLGEKRNKNISARDFGFLCPLSRLRDLLAEKGVSNLDTIKFNNVFRSMSNNPNSTPISIGIDDFEKANNLTRAIGGYYDGSEHRIIFSVAGEGDKQIDLEVFKRVPPKRYLKFFYSYLATPNPLTHSLPNDYRAFFIDSRDESIKEVKNFDPNTVRRGGVQGNDLPGYGPWAFTRVVGGDEKVILFIPPFTSLINCYATYMEANP
jgi:hypothetical protein